MKVFPATDSSNAAPWKNGEAVTVWERDERLHEGFAGMKDGKAMVCLGYHEHICPETGMHMGTEEEWSAIEPPHALGDVLAVGEEWCLIDNTGLASLAGGFGPIRYYEYRSDKPNDPHPGDWPAECADDPDCLYWQPAEEMPHEAARYWVRVESVEPKAADRGPMGPWTHEDPESLGWAYTLTPCNREGDSDV